MTKMLVLFGISILAAGYGMTQCVWAAELQAPSYSAAQAQEGEKAYMKHCSACHGSKLNNGMSDGAPALVGPGFVQQWGAQPLDELYTFTKTNMPLNAPRSLPSSTYTNLIAFLLSKNGIPSGATELPSDVAKLKELSGPR